MTFTMCVQVRGGTGGEEAALFALDLFRMYQRFAALKGWRWEQLAACERELLLQLLPKDEVDLRGIVLEVRHNSLCLQKIPPTPFSSLLSAQLI